MGKLGEQVTQVGVGVEGQRVELRGPVQGQGRHPVVDFEVEMPPLLRQAGARAERAHATPTILDIEVRSNVRYAPAPSVTGASPYWNPKTETLGREQLEALQLAKLRRQIGWAAER